MSLQFVKEIKYLSMHKLVIVIKILSQLTVFVAINDDLLYNPYEKYYGHDLH